MKRNSISTNGRVADLVNALVAAGWGFERRPTTHGMLRDPAGRFVSSVPFTTANFNAYHDMRARVRRHCRAEGIEEPAAIKQKKGREGA